MIKFGRIRKKDSKIIWPNDRERIAELVKKGFESTLDYCSMASKLDMTKVLSVEPLEESEIIKQKQFFIN